MKRGIFFIVLFLFIGYALKSQNTVGLITYNPSETYEGYNLMYPHNQPSVFLLNNCGEIVNEWSDDDNFRTGNIGYLRPDGSLVKAKRDIVVTDDVIWAGGGGETIEIRDWDNELVWSYTLNNEKFRLHHDIAPMENGNILALAWELKTREEAIEAGRDSMTMAQDVVWSEYVFEIDPSNSEIVWEWHAWDHLIQDFDATKSNFGVVADHPQKININYDTHNGHPDWLHINAMDYSRERDQILLSVPYFDEVWIVDHTTSTEQAAGENGGFGNRGGDLMYRWGNPAAYNSGDYETDRKLFFQHDAHFIDDFISPNNSNFNAIGVFNNRVGSDFSTVNVFHPAWDMYTWAYETEDENELFLPADHTITRTHPEPQKLFSTGLSSIQLLPNDNMLITSGRFGYTFELSPDDEILWEYITPLNAGAAAEQGDSLAINNNLTFRMKRYPVDYSAFEDRELFAQGYIEINPDTTFCKDILDVVVLIDDYQLELFPNPTSDYLIIDWDAAMYTYLKIYNAIGQEMASMMKTGGRTEIDVSQWESGLYIVQIDGKKAAQFVVSR